MAASRPSSGRLFRQPGGFERLLSIEKSASSSDLAVANPREDVDVHRNRNSALFPHATNVEIHEDRVAGRRERLRSHVKIAENAPHVRPPAPNAFTSAVGAWNIGELGEVVELGIRFPRGYPLLVSASVERLDGPTEDVDVLLRHRPLSIPPASTACSGVASNSAAPFDFPEREGPAQRPALGSRPG